MSRPTMKLSGLPLLAVLIISAGLPYMYAYYRIWNEPANHDFFFGVSFGQDTVEEAKLLIDRVKDYTNFFLINNWNVVTNETALSVVSEYAVKANLNFMVFFVVLYQWHLIWLDAAKEKWGDKFLGAYLYDEPGGRQIDTGRWFSDAGAAANPEYTEEYANILANASDYSDASKLFTTSVSSFYMQWLKERNIPVFTSDYALYWFDYLAGYDTAFAQLGWDHNTTKHVALCRGAANVQGKDWGAIITWTYYEPPYLASGPEIFEEMLTAYRAGAKYVIIFNYAEDPETGKPCGILKEEHFTAMKRFWNYIHAYSRALFEKVEGQVALVLPKDYGWGMRHQHDEIWGFWQADEKAPLIWENINKLITKYDLKLDIIYDDARFNYKEKYSKIYFWNATIN
jgi:hypothetical protein